MKQPPKSKAKPAAKKEVALFELETLKVDTLSIFKDIEKEQKELVKKNPFVAIKDTKTLDAAKAARTALAKGRTGLQNKDKGAASFLANFRKGIGTKIENLIAITKPAEDKQQAELDRYEKIQEDRRLAREREKEEADNRIKGNINAVVAEMSGLVDEMTYPTIESTKEAIEKLSEQHGGTFEEFDVLFDRDVENVMKLYEEKVLNLNRNFELAENNRKNSQTGRLTSV